MCLDRWDRPGDWCRASTLVLGAGYVGLRLAPLRTEVGSAYGPDDPGRTRSGDGEQGRTASLRAAPRRHAGRARRLPQRRVADAGKVVARSRESPTSSSRIPGTACSHSKSRGGRVRFDAQSGKWSSIGKSSEEPIKDPVKQANRASHMLAKALARAKRSGGEEISFGHGVAFPDCRVGRKPLRTDLPRELVLDHSDLDCLDTRLDALFQYWFDRDSKTPLGEPGLKVLDSVLAHSFDLQAPLVSSSGMTSAASID